MEPLEPQAPAQDVQRGSDWSDSEVAAIVADYRDMLLSELGGDKFNKSARNAALQKIMRRSRGSIEFKHQNISGVLHDLGLRFIVGYKPAANYQQLLADEVLAWLTAAPAEADLLATSNSQSIPTTAPVFERPGKPLVNERVRRVTVAKIDFASRDARNRELGRKGEEYVFELERKRLHDGGLKELAQRVRWISNEDGDGAGYDIASLELDGSERLIEVKTTTGTVVTPFFISANELHVAETRAAHYYLFRLHGFPQLPTIRVLRPPLAALVTLLPVSYRAQMR